jgi:hypothetical protein
MTSVLGRRLAVGAGGIAILAMVGLTAACSQEEQGPSETTETTTTTTTTTTPPPATTAPGAPAQPTEKAPRIDPNGPNPFSPTVIAPPAPTAIPGDHASGQ